MEIVKFVSLIVRLGIFLALCGQLKGCSLELLGKSASKNGIMSYSAYTKILTSTKARIPEQRKK